MDKKFYIKSICFDVSMGLTHFVFSYLGMLVDSLIHSKHSSGLSLTIGRLCIFFRVIGVLWIVFAFVKFIRWLFCGVVQKVKS